LPAEDGCPKEILGFDENDDAEDGEAYDDAGDGKGYDADGGEEYDADDGEAYDAGDGEYDTPKLEKEDEEGAGPADEKDEEEGREVFDVCTSNSSYPYES